MRRRDFLKLSATSAVGAVIFQACSFEDWGDGDPDSEFELQSPRQIPEDYLFNGDAWYATVSPDSPGSPGVIVRVFEGRAKKVEGNPNHPVNAGKLDARGQAMLQDLYHPDRLRIPMRSRTTGRPADREEISWNEALDELSEIVRNSQGSLLFITSPLSGALRQVIDSFVEGVGGERIVYETLDEAALHEALNIVFGSPQIPAFDIANAQFILSFGADWLQTWLSPTQFARAFGDFRRTTNGSPRGVLFHVDTYMSTTSGAADRWLPVRPGYEGILALAIARAIIDEGLAVDEAGFNALIGDQQLPTPEEAAEQTGISADMIRDVAQRLGGEGPSLVFGGGSAGAHSNGVANLVAIYALNVLIGNVNQPGGIQLPAPLPDAFQGLERDLAASVQDWQSMIARIQEGEFQTVFIYDANPVYGLSPSLGLESALQLVPNVVSFSRYNDETSNLATLYLPDNSPLESWGTVIPRVTPGYPVIGIQQPVVLRFYDTQPIGEVLLTIAEEVGLAEALPWATMQDLVREQAEALRASGRGNIQATGTAADYWTELLQTGVWMDPDAGPADVGETGVMPPMSPPQYGGDENEFPYYLVAYESPTLGAGQHAHLPWLQGLPDPITTVAWASWVNINPEVAREMGISFGDTVRVSTPVGLLELQAYVNPATPPNVLAIAMGQGHSHYTRYAEGRGVNVLTLLDPELLVSETGSQAWAGMRANLQRVPGPARKLPRMEGVVEMVAPDDYEIVRVVPPAQSGN